MLYDFIDDAAQKSCECLEGWSVNPVAQHFDGDEFASNLVGYCVAPAREYSDVNFLDGDERADAIVDIGGNILDNADAVAAAARRIQNARYVMGVDSLDLAEEMTLRRALAAIISDARNYLAALDYEF